MFWDFDPWKKRHSDPEPRIHKELTENARNRLANIMKNVQGNHIQRGYEEMLDYTGYRIEGFDNSSEVRAKKSQYKFILEDSNDIDYILSYLEYVLNVALSSTGRYEYDISNEEACEIIHKIERTFEDEGILVQVKPSASEILERNWRPSNDEPLQFQQVSDETIIEADQEVRTLALGDKWKEPLAPYNKAWQMYKDGTHTTAILEKLWNSLELTTEKICADLNDWEDEGKGVGRYLEILKNKDIFEPNPSMQQEASHITQSLRVTLNRLGGDRKRHADIDPDYCIFVLHQTSAYLSFIIKRYKYEYE